MEGKEISLLYQRDSYLNKDMDILINKDIFEYDLKSANISLCREYNLLPEPVIQSIEELPKKEVKVNLDDMIRTEEVDYNVGDYVYHETFGTGRVTEVSGSLITVAFKMPHGIKKLMKNHKKLSKVWYNEVGKIKVSILWN